MNYKGDYCWNFVRVLVQVPPWINDGADSDPALTPFLKSEMR
jgi:hypothetical protein